MELNELVEMASDAPKLAEKITGSRVLPDLAELRKIEPENHDVCDQVIRRDKTVIKPDPNDPENPDKNITETVKVARIPIALQKLIVQRQAAFLVGGGIQLDAFPKGEAQETIVEMLKKTWRSNKLDFKSKEIAKIVAVERECAELWYSEREEGYWDDLSLPPAVVGKMRCMILSPLKGDELYPIFDNTRDMIAFGRGYEVTIEGEKQRRLDVYTAANIYQLKMQEGLWTQTASIKNPTGKIPVIYHSKPRTAFQDVEYEITRLETVVSNHGDTNDYNGSPILAASGEVKGLTTKGESGKVFELENGAKLEYVTWNSAPESIKMEIENLDNLIYTISQTPNITFSEMKGLGQLSGIALKLLFLDATMKAKDDQDGPFGEYIQRRINFLLNAMSVINKDVVSARSMEVTPIFKDFLPNNLAELVDIYVSLVGAGILSKQTALELLALVKDVNEELAKIAKEAVTATIE